MKIIVYVVLALTSIMFIVTAVRAANEKTDCIIGFLTGMIFGLGLIISGMSKRSKVVGFLTLNSDWDPSLACVMLGAVGFNLVSFRFIFKRENPIMAPKFEVPKNNAIDLRLIVGACIFGFGWGLGGVCPGPGYVLIPIFNPNVLMIFMPALLLSHTFATIAISKYQKSQ